MRTHIYATWLTLIDLAVFIHRSSSPHTVGRSMSVDFSDCLVVSLLAGQLGFLGTAYAHAMWSGHLTYSSSHISAVLDDDVRSSLCATIGLLTLVPLILLEWLRDRLLSDLLLRPPLSRRLVLRS